MKKRNSKMKLSLNSFFVILIFAILKFRNIGRCKFWPDPKTFLSFILLYLQFFSTSRSFLMTRKITGISAPVSQHYVQYSGFAVVSGRGWTQTLYYIIHILPSPSRERRKKVSYQRERERKIVWNEKKKVKRCIGW